MTRFKPADGRWGVRTRTRTLPGCIRRSLAPSGPIQLRPREEVDADLDKGPQLLAEWPTNAVSMPPRTVRAQYPDRE